MSPADPRTAAARAFIEKQVELIRAGELEAVREGFTGRLRERVTAESLQRAVSQLRSLTIEDLVDSVATSGDGLKLKMKNGRTLTMLVSVGGEWKADTLWFK